MAGRKGTSRASGGEEELKRTLSRKINRRLARQDEPGSILAAFSIFGIVGWSIMVPALMGAYLGQWLDRTYGGRGLALTLPCVALGLAAGCANAGRWLAKENRKLNK